MLPAYLKPEHTRDVLTMFVRLSGLAKRGARPDGEECHSHATTMTNRDRWRQCACVSLVLDCGPAEEEVEGKSCCSHCFAYFFFFCFWLFVLWLRKTKLFLWVSSMQNSRACWCSIHVKIVSYSAVKVKGKPQGFLFL